MTRVKNKPKVIQGEKTTPFRFNQKKSIQATAFLLKQKPTTKTDTYMRLLKLLYIADRESLQETGRPITGDKFIAMKRGPTLSHLLNLAKQRAYDSSEWDKYIELNGFEITCVQDPGNDKLCRYEIDKLAEVWNKFRDKDEWEVSMVTHEFSEWKENEPVPPKKVNYIALSEVLKALGRSDWFEAITEDAQDDANFAYLFGET